MFVTIFAAIFGSFFYGLAILKVHQIIKTFEPQREKTYRLTYVRNICEPIFFFFFFFFFFCIPVLRVALGPRMKLAGCKSALNHPHPLPLPSFPLPGGLFYWRLFALRLFGFVCFLVLLVSGKCCGVIVAPPTSPPPTPPAPVDYSTDVCSLCACLVLSVSSSSWCLGWAAACDCGTPPSPPPPAQWFILLTFVRFALVCFCLFPRPLGVWEGLWLVIVAPLDFSLTIFLISRRIADQSTWRHFAFLAIQNASRGIFWSDCANAQAYLNVRR